MMKQGMSFELNDEMLDIIGNEFDIHKAVSDFSEGISDKSSEALDKFSKDFFERYGVDWMRRCLQLGEEYPDRTYEVLREANDSTGGSYKFPLIPQRFLEIAYLSTQDIEFLPVLENNPKRLVYRVEDCRMYKEIAKVCGGRIARMLPCKYACLNACKTLFEDLDFFGIVLDLEAQTNKNEYCQFSIKRYDGV